MPKLLAIALGLAALTAVPAYADSAVDAQIFGKDPDKDHVFACFTRHYDEAHLKAHPEQNVTDMLVLVDSSYDAESQSRGYGLTLGSNFRGMKTQFRSYGGCDGNVEGQKLSCYIDCDGGAIDVRFKDQTSILVDIPYGARIEDPNAPDDADPSDVPPKAEFGPDDKTFLLSRASPALCVDLVNDDEKQLLLDASK